MHHAPWRLRHIRPLPYAAFALSAAGVAVVSVADDPKTPWIGRDGSLAFGRWAC